MWEVLVQIAIAFGVITAISGVVLFGVWLKRKIDGPYADMEPVDVEGRLKFWRERAEAWDDDPDGNDVHMDHIQMHKALGDFDGCWAFGGEWKRTADGAWTKIEEDE